MALARRGRASECLITRNGLNTGYINYISYNKGGGAADLEALWRRNERSLCLSEFQRYELCDEKNNVHIFSLTQSEEITDRQSPPITSGNKVTPDEYLMGENYD